jgi:hypothetical protein
MTFTYVGDLSTDLDNVRFNIGDTVENTGVRPSGSNFTDEEIGGLITREGSWQKATAAIYETLAAEYARFVNLTLGPRREDMSDAAKMYKGLAEEWRAEYGTSSAGRVGSSAVTRVDAYSDDIPGDQV